MKELRKRFHVNKNYILRFAVKYTAGIYAVLGFVGTFTSLDGWMSNLLTVILQGKTPSTIGCVLASVVILVLVFLVLCVCAIVRVFTKEKYELMDVSDGHHVYVQYGDVFSEKEVEKPEERRNIIIPVNRCFDTIIDDDLVSSRTVHGIAMRRLYEQGIYTEQSLSDAIVKKPSETLEDELIDVLDASLRDTCQQFNWEYDSTAIMETFLISANELRKFAYDIVDQEVMRSVLSQATGQEISDEVLEYWCIAVYSNLSKEKNQYLYRFALLMKMDFLLIEKKRQMVVETSFPTDIDNNEVIDQVCTTSMEAERGSMQERVLVSDLDLYDILVRKFDEIQKDNFMDNKDVLSETDTKRYSEEVADESPSDNKGFRDIQLKKDWLDAYKKLSPDEKIKVEDSIEYSHFLTTGEIDDFYNIIGRRYDEKECRPEAKESQEADAHHEGWERYFSLYNPEGINTVVYLLTKLALPDKHKWVYFPVRLDSAVEFIGAFDDDDYKKRFTYFLDTKNGEENDLLFIEFGMTSVRFRFGKMEGGCVRASNDTWRNQHRSSSPNIEFWNGVSVELRPFDLDNTAADEKGYEKYQYKYSLHEDRFFFILSKLTTAECRPVLKKDDHVGTITLNGDESYIAFEVRNMGDSVLTDFQIALAYYNGKMGLKQDYSRAFEYFRIAEAEGDIEAKSMLADMYEKGQGCKKNVNKAARLRADYRNR